MGLRMRYTPEVSTKRIGELHQGAVFFWPSSINKYFMVCSAKKFVALNNGEIFDVAGFANDTVHTVPKGSTLEVE